MSTAASLDRPARALPGVEPDEPAHSDGFIRGLSEAIGGPLGDFAARPPRRPGGRPRFWSAARAVLALTCLTLSLHWVQKFPCNDGAWVKLEQYRQFCYSDVVALYYAKELSAGAVPYVDHAVEYPVLTGIFMGLIGLPVHALGAGNASLNQVQLFYNLNALAIGALAVATVALLLSLRRRRPWDIAMFAVSPGLFLSATVNWDLLSVGLFAIGWYLWARRRPALAGIFVGLAASAKLWPILLAVPLLALCLRAGRMEQYRRALLAGIGTVLAVNLPVALLYPESWFRFFEFNSERAIDWGTIWYIGDHFPLGGERYGLAPFQWLGTHIPVLNVLSWVLIAAGLVGITMLIMRAPRRPRLAQVAFLTIAVFLIFNKVWSQQFVLWLIPLAVLARPRWGAFMAWQGAEAVYFFIFYGQLMGASGKNLFPEWVFVTASTVRLGTLCVLVWLVINEIMNPELDVVRRSYGDDPDGGVLDGAPDRSPAHAEVGSDPAGPEAQDPGAGGGGPAGPDRVAPTPA